VLHFRSFLFEKGLSKVKVCSARRTDGESDRVEWSRMARAVGHGLGSNESCDVSRGKAEEISER
jgi:hypothetical protein